ncbi:MAG: hypothetical protein L3V56_07580 [Candidatus Magnetoovum sp. WYHC-5]|nr:hypothetical protein [Candidatus Magnetoovum sp. WYHC-5]
MSVIVINTNMMSVNSQKLLKRSITPLQTAMERLSSGLRINSAKDDAAGLAVATRMTTQIRGLTVGVRNLSDGLSVVQTAEGSIEEVVSSLQRIREIAVQAKSGQYGASDVSYMQFEVNSLVEDIGRIAEQSRFNGIRLFDGSFNINIVAGYLASDAPVSINIDKTQIYDRPNNLTNGVVLTATVSQATIMEGTTWGISDWVTNPLNNVAAERGVLADVITSLSVTRVSGVTTGKYALLRDNPDYDSANPSVAPQQISNASNSIAIIDGSLNSIIRLRSYLGAKANQFESALRSVDNVLETTKAARSRIMDADFAAETANITRALILQQSSISVLSQANSIPQNVLALLK